MNKNIDLTELLKDCPSGMELDCTIYDNVTLKSVSLDINGDYPISIETKCGFNTKLTKYGQNICIDDAKCVIFPKGKTTWKGFHRPFMDGDIIYVCDEYSDATFTYVAILKQIEKGGEIFSHCFYNYEEDYFNTNDFLYDCYNTRFATEEEKEKLFQAIKDNGYKWNSETKTLENLIVPKFKVGDIIRSKNGLQAYKITNVTPEYYSVKVQDHACVGILQVKDQDDWILIPNKLITEYKIYYTRDSTGEDHHLTFSTQEAMEGCLECMRETNKTCTTYLNIVCKKETVETLDL